MLARRLRELAGLGLIALSGGAAAALMTWSVQDPSLSHATSRAIRNIVGYPGAIGADLLMQILGLGSIMLILPLAVRGWRMLTHRHFDREALRMTCWILCSVLTAGFASCWPHSGAWPLPTGLGGVVGDALMRAPTMVFGQPGFIYRFVLGIILCAAMIASFLMASGFGSREPDPELSTDDDDAPFEEDDDDGSVSLGWAFHAVMSAKARLWRFLLLAYRWLVSSAPAARASSFDRREPNLGGGPAATALAPRNEEDSNCRRFPCSPCPRLKTASR
jgi:S-DNA-T family DNA segregation ATPase FtsK/SpoIIIE